MPLVKQLGVPDVAKFSNTADHWSTCTAGTIFTLSTFKFTLLICSQCQHLFLDRQFIVFGLQDQWSNVQDAQNAAATRALFDLRSLTGAGPSLDQVYHVLPSPYRELWRKWYAESATAGQEEVDKQQQEKEDFVR